MSTSKKKKGKRNKKVSNQKPNIEKQNKTKEKINDLKNDDESIIVTEWSEFKKIVDIIDND